MKNISLSICLFSILILSCSNEDDSIQTTCEDAIDDSSTAQTNFQNATSDEFTFLCEEYKIKLQNQIDICGDVNGSIQAIIDSLGNCEEPDDDDNNTVQAMMTANIDGTQENNMRPNGFGLLSDKAVNVVTFSYANDFDYIKIQGDNTWSEIFPSNTTKEINLFIPENTWQEGTYTLLSYPVDPDDDLNGYTEVYPHVDVNFFYNDNASAFVDDTEGFLTITNFDSVNRVISGTFEFQYLKSEDAGDVSGPYQCNQGTFTYSLNDDYFD